MKMRNVMAALALGTLVFGTASFALARPHHLPSTGCYATGYYGNGGVGYQSLSPEKRAVADKLIQEHLAAMKPLREQLQAKRLELDALSRNPNVQPEQISRLAGEVASLSAQMRDAGDSFRTKMAEETGLGPVPFSGRGLGAGSRGCDCGRGPVAGGMGPRWDGGMGPRWDGGMGPRWDGGMGAPCGDWNASMAGSRAWRR